jgi:type IV pilus assembly protein PilM
LEGKTSSPLFVKKEVILGLDIGLGSIKAVQLKKHGSKIILQGFALGQVPPSSIKEGVISDPKGLGESIRAILNEKKHGRVDAKVVNIALPESKIFTRLVTLPRLSKKDLIQAIRYEVDQSIPLSYNDLFLDWRAIGEYHDGKQELVDYLLAAAPRVMVQSYLELLKVLQFTPNAFEVELESITRAMIFSHSSHHHAGPILVVDIGTETTDVTVFANQALRLTGSAPVGGQQFTESIAAVMEINKDKAEETKVKYGLGDTGLQLRIKKSIEPALETIVSEIKRIIRFYEDRDTRNTQIETIILSGGSSALIGLQDYLTTSVGLPVEIANPWSGIDTDALQPISRISSPIYTTAIGLALGGFDVEY